MTRITRCRPEETSAIVSRCDRCLLCVLILFSLALALILFAEAFERPPASAFAACFLGAVCALLAGGPLSPPRARGLRRVMFAGTTLLLASIAGIDALERHEVDARPLGMLPGTALLLFALAVLPWTFVAGFYVFFASAVFGADEARRLRAACGSDGEGPPRV
jgi:hypothetical protein